MPARRPTSVLVIAIFHFLFGGLGLIIGLVGVGFAAYALTQPQTPPGYRVTTYPPDVMDTMRYMDSNVPGYRLFQLPSALFGLALSAVLVAAGFGLVHVRPWGRLLSILYGVGSILYQIGAMIYIVLYLTPAQVALYDTMPPPPGVPPAAAQSMISMMKTLAGCSQFAGLIGLIYPIVVLFIMFLPSVRAAFSGAAYSGPDEADQHDRGGPPEDHGRLSPGYGDEPDDRFGSAPR